MRADGPWYVGNDTAGRNLKARGWISTDVAKGNEGREGGRAV